MSQGFSGGIQLSRLNITTSPHAYEVVDEVMSVSGLGKSNPLIDVTSFDSAAREYLAGLPEGQEISVEAVRVHTASNKQDNLISDIDNKLTSGFKLTLTNTLTSPNLVKTYTFSAVCLSWVINPSFDDANKISFTLKISGAITVA